MAHELDVWLFDSRVGVLRLVDGRLSFCYVADWLLRPDAVGLSCSLPLREQPFDDEHTRPFFAGLLPEGQLRRLIAQQFRVSTQNDFGLLKQIGGECAGAVTLLAPHQVFSPVEPTSSVRWLSDEEIVSLLDELPRRPMLAGKDGLRLSLAGAQDKLPVVVEGDRIGVPINGAPSSHILKPPIQNLADTVINECFCLTLAEAMQLQAAQSYVRFVLGRSFLLVKRYDRIFDENGHLQRLHQEDFCQALGVVPEMKYQNEGGPDIVQSFDLIRRVTSPSAPNILRLFDLVVFNALIGNHDAHAKNFSFLFKERSVVLAPAYDVLSTAIYPNLTPKMAMKIGGKYKFNEVKEQHWEQFSQMIGLSHTLASKRILALAKSMPLVAHQLQSDSYRGFMGRDVVTQIITLIEQRCALTIKNLGG